MGIIGGLFNKHTDEDVGKDTLTIGRSDIPVIGADVQKLGGLQSALGSQLGMGGGFQQAGQQGLGLMGQALGMDQQALGGQNSLAQMLMDQAQGRGPSLAGEQLKQGLQQNQAAAASAMASQRGINPALAARMVGNQQAAAGQQMAGQAAQARMQEQLNAQSGLGNLLSQQRQAAQGMMGAGNQLFGQAGQLGVGNLNALGNIFGQQNQAELGRVQSLADQYKNVANNQNAYNAMRLQQAEGNATRRQQVATGNTQGDNATGGSIIGGIGGMFGLAHGGAIPASQPAGHPTFAQLVARELHRTSIPEGGEVMGGAEAGNMAKGGAVRPYQFTPMDVRKGDDKDAPATPTGATGEGTDSEGKKKVLKLADGGAADGGGGFLSGLGNVFMNAWHNAQNRFDNGPLGQLMHPGIQSSGGMDGAPRVAMGDSTAGAGGLLPDPSVMAPTGSLMGGKAVMAGGGKVPGQANVAGDSERNDTVPAMLSPGEVVLPRTVAASPSKAASFVQRLIDEGEIHPAIVEWEMSKKNRRKK